MTAFLPDATTLLTYTVACIILFITPGPDMSLYLARTLTAGRTAGIASMIGATLGCAVHTTLAAIGVSAVLAASETAFFALKVAGALYLLWLAIDAIRSGSLLQVEGPATKRLSFWSTLGMGFLVNLSNPKIVLFFVTFLPQFVCASDPHVMEKVFFLGFYFLVISVPMALAVIFAADRLVRFIKARRWLLRGIDYTFAGIFALFAVSFLFTTQPESITVESVGAESINAMP